jgi:type I restriction enzyme, S subunit
MSYTPYPKYKHSGVEWLGQIPEGWGEKRLKFVTSLRNKKVSIEGRKVVALENIEGGTGRFLATKSSYSGDDVAFSAGDVLFGKLRPYLSKVYLTQSDGVAFGDLLAYYPQKGVFHSKFCFYLLISGGFISKVDSSTYGSKMPRASSEFVAEMGIALPSIQEQKAIAAFLDRETRKIDLLVEKQERLIELLKEKRQALISHCVTKGLNPNAKMKDSGVEWLGEIPKEWKISKLGNYSMIFNGSTPDRNVEEYWENGTIPWLSSSKVNDTIVEQPSELISKNAFNKTSLRMVPLGSVIIGLVGQGKTRGMSSLLGISTTINQNLAAIVPGRKVIGKFIQLLFQHLYMPIREYGRGANQAALNGELISELTILIPPIQEQKTIATFLDRETQKIDTLVETANSAITLLKERRTALISAAVTGKIDIRNQVNPEEIQ